jgi:hypothetical protein
MAITIQDVIALLQEANFEVRDTCEIPSRSAELRPVPDCLGSAVGDRLRYSYPGGLYSHQAGAIEAAAKGADIVLASATASGKSLPFMAFGAHLATQDPDSRVLALYPARALIQDQLKKWREFLRPLGISLAYIDGGVPVGERSGRVARAQVVLMTPDVAHAWLMSNLHDSEVLKFLQHLKLLILDEAHVYEGAFGTNMAFLLRRLQVAAGPHQLICSTATLGEPATFVDQLTGRRPVAFGAEEDGAPSPGKTVVRVSPPHQPFEATVSLLRAIARTGVGRFIAFADSRRQVEQFVAATLRSSSEGEDASADSAAKILPYRAGYEPGDREQIQESLGRGDLAGQALREAFPGAVYYYMARPYRVLRLDGHRSEIRTRHERWYTTTPLSQTRVFPRFAGGTHYLQLSERGFVAEVEMQVSERLMGFVERRGNVREQYEYSPGSPYSQKPLTRFFETTGVCWSFASLPRISENAGKKLLEAFAFKFGIQERDLGVGVFSAKPSPRGPEQIQGICIYDTTAGSLRLTQRLAEHFAETVAWASESLIDDYDAELSTQLMALAEAASSLQAAEPLVDVNTESTDDDWVILVAPGERAILTNASGTQEVEVTDFRYTPRGIVYDLQHRTQDVRWSAPAETVQPIYGETKLVRFNLMTGERVEL